MQIIKNEINEIEGGMEEEAQEEQKSIPVEKPQAPPQEFTEPMQNRNIPAEKDELQDMIKNDA